MEAIILAKRQAFPEIYSVKSWKRIFMFGDEYGKIEMRWLLRAK
jgi:hypothetical protein